MDKKDLLKIITTLIIFTGVLLSYFSNKYWFLLSISATLVLLQEPLTGIDLIDISLKKLKKMRRKK